MMLQICIITKNSNYCVYIQNHTLKQKYYLKIGGHLVRAQNRNTDEFLILNYVLLVLGDVKN